jgi:hypothetical protein
MIECNIKVCMNNNGYGYCNLDSIVVEIQKVGNKNLPTCGSYYIDMSDI